MLSPTGARPSAASERRSRHAREGNAAADGGLGIASGGAEASIPRGKFGEAVTGYWAIHSSTLQRFLKAGV